jgi:formylglycine-generating enzyme required for sulfatase activity
MKLEMQINQDQIGLSPIVTVKDYFDYLLDDDHKSPSKPKWWTYQLGQPDRPIVGINYEMAEAYAQWKNSRLPTLEQWYAALSPERRKVETKTANIGHGRSTIWSQADQHLRSGDNMIGNVWEWTSTSPQKRYKCIVGLSWNSDINDILHNNLDRWALETLQESTIGFRILSSI